MNRMTKTYRQGQILKLIRGKRISTQEELAQELKNAGHRRHPGDALARHSRPAPGEDARRLPARWRPKRPARSSPCWPREFLKDVLRAQNLVVLKTSPGHANSVAVALDNEEWPEVVGTIAGDDTILVITPDTPTGEAVQEKLLDLLERS